MRHPQAQLAIAFADISRGQRGPADGSPSVDSRQPPRKIKCRAIESSLSEESSTPLSPILLIGERQFRSARPLTVSFSEIRQCPVDGEMRGAPPAAIANVVARSFRRSTSPPKIHALKHRKMGTNRQQSPSQNADHSTGMSDVFSGRHWRTSAEMPGSRSSWRSATGTWGTRPRVFPREFGSRNCFTLHSA